MCCTSDCAVFQNGTAPEKKDNSDCGDENTNSVLGNETVNGAVEKSDTKLSKRERKEERKRLAKKGEKKDKEETEEGKAGKKKKRKLEEDAKNENEHKSKNKSKKSKINGTEVDSEPVNKKQRTEDATGEYLSDLLIILNRKKTFEDSYI